MGEENQRVPQSSEEPKTGAPKLPAKSPEERKPESSDDPLEEMSEAPKAKKELSPRGSSTWPVGIFGLFCVSLLAYFLVPRYCLPAPKKKACLDPYWFL